MADDTRHAPAPIPQRTVRGRPFPRKIEKKEKPRKQVSREASKRLLAIEERMQRQEAPARPRNRRDEVLMRRATRSGFDMPVDRYREYLRGFERNGSNTIRVQKRKDEPVERVTFTNFGRYTQLFTKPATRNWNAISAKNQEKLAEHYLRTTHNYLETTQQKGKGDHFPRKLRAGEVREQRIPALLAARAELQETIDRETQHYAARLRPNGREVGANEAWKRAQVEYVNGLTRRASILDGIIAHTQDGKYDALLARIERPRKRKNAPAPTRNNEKNPREIDPTPTRWTAEPPPRDVGSALWKKITTEVVARREKETVKPKTPTRKNEEPEMERGYQKPRTLDEYERAIYAPSPHPHGFHGGGKGSVGKLPASFGLKPYEGRPERGALAYLWRDSHGRTRAELNEADFIRRTEKHRAEEAARATQPPEPTPLNWRRRFVHKTVNAWKATANATRNAARKLRRQK